MCGLVALFDILGRRPIDAALLERMTDALAHRGPDGAGLHVAVPSAASHDFGVALKIMGDGLV